jgi:hypothetical protein
VTVVEFEYNGRTVAAPQTDGPSLLEASNLVAVTASVGSTLDALSGLMRLSAELDEMARTRALVQEASDLDAPLPSSAGMEEDLAQESGEGDERVGSEVNVTQRGAELPGGRQPALASRARFEITSRDRLHLQLASLPRRFHEMVAGVLWWWGVALDGVNMCSRKKAHTHARTYAHTHIRMHARARARAHTHTHTHRRIWGADASGADSIAARDAPARVQHACFCPPRQGLPRAHNRGGQTAYGDPQRQRETLRRRRRARRRRRRR